MPSSAMTLTAVMNEVFENVDLIYAILKSFLVDYSTKWGPFTNVSDEYPTYRDQRVRSQMIELLRSLHSAMLTSHQWRVVSQRILNELLALITTQFASGTRDILKFVTEEPTRYVSIGQDTTTPEKAIRILHNTNVGKRALEPMRAFFEHPFDTAIEPLGLWGGARRRPAATFRRAGHWLRKWVTELALVDPPTHNVAALSNALTRGCCVCGCPCQLATCRFYLDEAAVNGDLNNNTGCSTNSRMSPRALPKDSLYTSLHALVRVPWDLVSIDERPMQLQDATTYGMNAIDVFSGRVWMYTCPSHIVWMTIFPSSAHNIRRRRTEEDDFKSIQRTNIEILHKLTTRISDCDDLEMDLALLALKKMTTDDGRPFLDALADQLEAERRLAIENANVPLATKTEWVEREEDQMEVGLPLYPAHGKPESHSWVHVLGFGQANKQTWFLDLIWQNAMRPSHKEPWETLLEKTNVNDLEAWRTATLVRTTRALSVVLPRRHTAFFRYVECFNEAEWKDEVFNPTPDPTGVDYDESHITLMHTNRAMDTNRAFEAACRDNWQLCLTWPWFAHMARTPTRSPEDLARVLRVYASPPEWHYERESVDPSLVTHMKRLDCILGKVWKQASRFRLATADGEVAIENLPPPPEDFRGGNQAGVRDALIRLARVYIGNTQDLVPNLLSTPVFGGIRPAGPRHPDVLLRWLLHTIVQHHPSKRSTPATCRFLPLASPMGRPEVILEVHNTFLMNPNAPPCGTEEVVCGRDVGVQLSFTATTKVAENDITMQCSIDCWKTHHARITMGVSIAVLYDIERIINATPEASALARERTKIVAMPKTIGLGTSVDTISGRWMSLPEWNALARAKCKAISTYAQTECAYAITVLTVLLDAQWVPVLKPPREDATHVFRGWSYGKSEKGVRALTSLCTPSASWFCNVREPTPFCVWRGGSQCTCLQKCVFPSE